jgi:hypothetical protein
VLIEPHAKTSFGQAKGGFADLDERIAPHVVAVQLDQVEGL